MYITSSWSRPSGWMICVDRSGIVGNVARNWRSAAKNSLSPVPLTYFRARASASPLPERTAPTPTEATTKAIAATTSCTARRPEPARAVGGGGGGGAACGVKAHEPPGASATGGAAGIGAPTWSAHVPFPTGMARRQTGQESANRRPQLRQAGNQLDCGFPQLGQNAGAW